MIKRRIYTALLVAAALCFLSVPVPVMAERWHHHRPPGHHGHHHGHHGHHHGHHGHHRGPRSGVHFGIFLGAPVVTPYYSHGHYLHVHDSRCPVVVGPRVPLYIHPVPTWGIRR
jgi:hypothetical protein